MKNSTRIIIGIILIILTIISFFLVIKVKNGLHMQSSEIANLRSDNIMSVYVKPIVNPDYSTITLDQNQTVRLVHALNHGLELPELKPDQIINMEVSIALTNGKQITIGDSGETEFLITLGTELNSQKFMIASTELKDLLEPFQSLFVREISLRNNISVYGTERVIGYVLEDTTVHEDASNYSREVFNLKQGDMIRILAKKTSQGIEWYFIDSVAFSLPNPVGWVESAKITAQLPAVKPNQGFVKEVNIFTEPSFDSMVVQENYTGPAQIKKRVGNWTNCLFAGGMDGWVEESDILYSFPAGYDMGY